MLKRVHPELSSYNLGSCSENLNEACQDATITRFNKGGERMYGHT